MNRHDEFVRDISEHLNQSFPSLLTIEDYVYTTSQGKPAQVDIMVVDKNLNPTFLEVKTKDTGGLRMRAHEGYRKFESTYKNKLPSGLYVTPQEVGFIDIKKPLELELAKSISEYIGTKPISLLEQTPSEEYSKLRTNVA